MKFWKKILLGSALTLGAAASWASGGGVAWDKAPVNVRDMASLERLLDHWRGCPDVDMEGAFTHFCVADTDP
ncbi:MAG: hypothetical protein IKH84_03980, partial [Ottowia sp.]|nr:hypothetical protein [Ottowia sp.]